MKLNDAVSGELVGENIGSSNAFGFEVNAKAFRLLSDNIYKDKIGSIVRELSCNAFDAHKQAGNEKEPFFIHLPVALERYFSIRDYGIGLDKPDVLTIYSTYFKSTKDNSNDMIGAFGLGSKTPFSYTDTFTIKSFFNGKLYIFVAMVDSDGVPVLTEIGTENTTERNGLEISFAVENYSDFSQFFHACNDQLRFFEVKPTLNVGQVTENYCTILNDYGSLKILSGGEGIYIKIGQVGYLVDKYDGMRQKFGADYAAFFDIFPNVLIDAGIGNVEVTVSRESIAFSKKTISFLEKLIDEKKKIIFAGIEQDWNAADNDFERIKLLEKFPKPTKIAGLLKLKFASANIQSLSAGFFYTIQNNASQIGVVAQSRKTITGMQLKYDPEAIIQLSSKNSYVQSAHVKYYRWRLKALMDVTEKNVYVIDLDDEKIAQHKSFLASLPLVNAETLPLPADFATRKKTMRPTYWITKLRHVDGASLARSEQNYDDFDDDIISEKVYILREYAGSFSPKWSSALLGALEKDKILNYVCSIRPSDYDAIKDLPNYISLDSFIEKKISEISNDKIKEIIKLSKNLQVFRNIKHVIEESALFNFSELSKSNLAKTVRNVILNVQTRITKLEVKKNNLDSTLSKTEAVLISDRALQYNTDNYSSVVSKYIDNCVEQHEKQINAINFLGRKFYYAASTPMSYLVGLVDAELAAVAAT